MMEQNSTCLTSAPPETWVIMYVWFQESAYNNQQYIDIICVDPQTGKSVREYDMSSLWPANQRGGGENVLNGIALAKDHVLITGKRWDRMYKLHLPDWPTLFRN